VIGRIILLVSSIITIKNINGIGVPCGRRCESIWFVFFIQPNSVSLNHIVRDNGKLLDKWDVNEKICGYKAIKFIKIILTKIVIMMVSVPFSVFIKEKLTSFFRVFNTFCLIFVKLLFLFQIFLLVNKITKIKFIQDKEKIDVLGSKIENRLFTSLFFFVILLFLDFFYFVVLVFLLNLIS